jgi:choline-sulfatase
MKSGVKTIKAKRGAILPALLIIGFLVTGCSLSVKEPNVIMIVCDQLSPRAMGWTGDTEVITPNLDQFSNAAYCFTNAYCTSPLGGPARHSLYTGVYPSEHWVLKNNMHMKEDLPSIISMLNKHNYTTGNIGEMQSALHHEFMVDHGGRSAYKSYLQSELEKIGLDYKPHEQLLDGKNGWQERDSLTFANSLPEELTLGQWTTNEALKFIDKQQEDPSNKPFYMQVSYASPQKPYAPVEKYADRYLDKMEKLKLPPNFSFEELQKWSKRDPDSTDSLSIEDVKYARAMYFGFVTQLDAALGKLFKGIKERGLMENTIIVFTADHGDNLGEHGQFNGHNMLEASVGVPLMIKFPGKNLAERSIIDDNVSHVDVVTTLLNAVGLAPSQSMPGKDLRPLIEGKEDWTDHAVYAEFYKYRENPSQLMLRKGDYKLTYNIELEFGGFEMKLYNIKEDPWEQMDLFESGEHAVIMMDMSDELMNDYYDKIWNTLPRQDLSSSNN